MKSRHETVRSWLLVGLLVLAAVPALAKRKKPAEATYCTSVLEVQAEAAPIINLDPAGHPLSVVVRVYLLKDKLEFSKLTYDLAASGRPDPEILGEESLGKLEYTVLPGSTLKEVGELHPETRYLGVVAMFRNPDPHFWRCLAKVDPPPRPANFKEAEPAKRGFIKRLFGRKPRTGPAPKNTHLAIQLKDCQVRLLAPKAEPIPGLPEAQEAAAAPGKEAALAVPAVPDLPAKVPAKPGLKLKKPSRPDPGALQKALS